MFSLTCWPAPPAARVRLRRHRPAPRGPPAPRAPPLAHPHSRTPSNTSSCLLSSAPPLQSRLLGTTTEVVELTVAARGAHGSGPAAFVRAAQPQPQVRPREPPTPFRLPPHLPASPRAALPDTPCEAALPCAAQSDGASGVGGGRGVNGQLGCATVTARHRNRHGTPNGWPTRRITKTSCANAPCPRGRHHTTEPEAFARRSRAMRSRA
jgi:hypothetical protein